MALTTGVDTMWGLLASFLVFFMQAGFGMVEAGFIRAKNACNILMKNFLDFALGCIFFFLVGYAFMFAKGGGLAQLGVQALGLVAAGAFAVGSMTLVFYGIKKTIGLRVTKEEELRGLDIGEHGMESYAGFQVFVTQ